MPQKVRPEKQIEGAVTPQPSLILSLDDPSAESQKYRLIEKGVSRRICSLAGEVPHIHYCIHCTKFLVKKQV
jgi:hypothetical protein